MKRKTNLYACLLNLIKVITTSCGSQIITKKFPSISSPPYSQPLSVTLNLFINCYSQFSRVSVKPGTVPKHPRTPRNTPGTPRTTPGTPPEHPRNTWNNSSTPLEYPIIPGTPRNSQEHPHNTKNNGQRSDSSRFD